MMVTAHGSHKGQSDCSLLEMNPSVRNKKITMLNIMICCKPDDIGAIFNRTEEVGPIKGWE